ncbi:MAG: phytoene/squalene synthase family protein [Bacteroidales bacterium]|nr:phytoene/squalene synthase family protein [Bacteroidales bacterium]
MKDIFDIISRKSSKLTTNTYSTSFSLGIRVFDKKFHEPVYAIYGFVRFADEIVDSFHGYDKKKLLDKFRGDTYEAIRDGISLNPILNHFQWVVNKYAIERELIDLFLESMEMDLEKREHDEQSFKKYILGSAEVVGLMCLRVFTEGNDAEYQKLKPSAMSLGSAFQKVNFMRDLYADQTRLGRSYFPMLKEMTMDDKAKDEIISDIQKDFDHAYKGIRQLPKGAKFGVYVAYIYYLSLLKKLKRTKASVIMNRRIRIPDSKKYSLLIISAVKSLLRQI